jgi:hypothetical protein
MALTNKEIKAIKNFADNIKNSGMNPWGSLVRGKDARELPMGKNKNTNKVFNKEDATEQPNKEKFKNKK